MGWLKEGNVLYNDASQHILFTVIYDIIHMVKDHSDSERENPLPPLHGLLFPINSKGSFICTIPQTGLVLRVGFKLTRTKRKIILTENSVLKSELLDCKAQCNRSKHHAPTTISAHKKYENCWKTNTQLLITMYVIEGIWFFKFYSSIQMHIIATNGKFNKIYKHMAVYF